VVRESSSFGVLDPKLNEALMDGRAKTCPEAPREMTFRKGASAGEILDVDISLQMRSQHLLGSELLPRFQPAPRSECELWRAAVRLQGVSTEHHRNLIERQPVQRLAVIDRVQNALCHLRNNQVFDKERFLKTERRRDAVVERDPLKQPRRKVIVQVIERPRTHISILQFRSMNVCRKRYCSRNPTLFPL